MRAFFYFLLFSVLFAVATVAGIPYLVSAQSMRDQVVAVVKQQTGRDLSIEGETEFFVFPKIGLRATRVSLSNPPGMGEGPFARMAELRVSLKVLALLGGRIDLDEFILVRPEIDLVVDERRQNNWTFAPPRGGAEPDGERGAPSGSPEKAEPAPDTAMPRRLALGRVSISEGRFSYVNKLTGASHKAEKINITVTAPDFSKPLEARGSAIWRGEKVDIALLLQAPGGFFQGKLSGVEMKVTAPSLSAEFKGTVARPAGLLLEGKLAAASSSLRALAGWAGSPLPPGRGLGDFQAFADMSLSDDILTLSNADIGLDGMTASGTASLDLAAERPSLEAKLALDVLDLDAYLGPGPGLAGGAEGTAGAPARARAAAWSEAPIDFSGLSAVDAVMNLTARRILYGKVEIGRSALNVTLKDGRLNAELRELALYGGAVKGVLVLDGAAATPALRARASLENVSSLPLLKNALGFDWIEGNANLQFDLSSRGKSQKAMVSGLTGNGKVLFSDGAVRGINIAQMVRSLGTATLTGWNRAAAKKTDFSSLSGTFTIKNGVASNTDLAMIGPLVRLRGAGNIDMPPRRIHYKMTPKLVASLEGQGGDSDLAGLDVPIIIRGAWSNPRIYPDIAGILDNPQEAYARLKDIGSKIKQGGVKSLLNSLIGSGSAPAPAGDVPAGETGAKKKGTLETLEEQLRKDPTKAFKKLF